MRIALITLLAVVAMGASVLVASHSQRDTAEKHRAEAALADGVLADLNRLDASISAYALTGDPEMLADHDEARERLELAFDGLAEVARDDAAERGAVADQRRAFATLQADVASALFLPNVAARRRALRARTAEQHATVDRFSASNAALRARQSVVARGESRRASYVAPALIVGLSALFGVAAALTARRARRATRAGALRRSQQGRFAEAMQVSESQAEAHRLLKTHLERVIPDSSITVLNRNNSADRLEASTTVDAASPLVDALQQARPRSCMAVRLSRAFRQGDGSDEVLSCEVCGVSASSTTCQPLLVGGEVIGAVLVEHEGPLAEERSRSVADSVAQSAPMLANLRNLAIAETRAATDALTGLPNRRAVDDTLLRMLAQAGRSFDPLSVILLDLDHFKVINDTFGHDRGDEVLAAFGTRLREVLRTGDFAGRSGGEEFVLFLPDTDRTGAVRVAERLRERMRGLTVPGVERAITASFGVACFPDDAVDAATLMRCADRALYAAKSRGRDRVEASSTGAPPPPAADATRA